MRLNHNIGNGRQRPGLDSAYTLVEVLCALALGAIVISAMFTAFNNGFAILRLTRDDERATQILMQKTEAIRVMTWANLSNCPTTFQDSYNPTGTNGTQGTTYYGTISRFGDPTNLPSTVYYRSNVYLVTITLTWSNSLTTSNNSSWTPVGHTRQAQTLLAQQGMQSYLYGGLVDTIR